MKKTNKDIIAADQEANRRAFLKSSVAAASALILGNVLPANASQESSQEAEQDADDALFLFVQHANNIKLEKNTLRLSGLGHSTIYFSDRPERIAGHMLSSDFISDWQKGTEKDSFKLMPPNANVSIFNKGDVYDVVMTLSNPRMVEEELHYDIKILDDGMPMSLVSGPGSLFIDPIGKPLSAGSVAGVHRRHRRRARRVVGGY